MSEEDIKAQTKRKPQPQEKHYDGCGSDTGPIEEVNNRSLLAHSRGSIDDAVEASCCSVPDDFEEPLRENHSHLHYLLGSEVDEDHAAFIHKPEDASFVESHHLLAFLAQLKLEGKIDVMGSVEKAEIDGNCKQEECLI